MDRCAGQRTPAGTDCHSERQGSLLRGTWIPAPFLMNPPARTACPKVASSTHAAASPLVSHLQKNDFGHGACRDTHTRGRRGSPMKTLLRDALALSLGLLSSLPIPALSKGPPLTDAELEQIAAQPEEPERPTAAVAAQWSRDRVPAQRFLIPYARPDGQLGVADPSQFLGTSTFPPGANLPEIRARVIYNGEILPTPLQR